MGFGESAAHIIFFIAIVLVASSVSAVMAVTIQKITIEISKQGEHLKDVISTDFEVINDPVAIPTKTVNGNTAYVFYVKNVGTGSFLFSNETLTIMIDGSVIPKSNIYTSPIGSLKHGEVGEIDVVTTLSSGDHKLRIFLDNGISDSFEFTI